MPTTLRLGAYRFYFYSYDCTERRHTHVDRETSSAKFWIDPEISLAGNHGFRRHELRTIERYVRDNVETLRREWDAFCGDNGVEGDGGAAVG